MIFIYKYWDAFCHALVKRGIRSITAQIVVEKKYEEPYLILKHDVETDVSKAYVLASIEKKYGHCGSYYVQAYLLNSKKNVRLLKLMSEMGHEISYHYDVMDSQKGDLEEAIKEFERNRKIFEYNGFRVKTVCQHGNPVIERQGYTSNRDFFRSKKVQKLYPEISDIMVNFPVSANTDYVYYSDAGREFRMIYDPLNNDIVNSEEKNICYGSLNDILKEVISQKKNVIISTHPHRWAQLAITYQIKAKLFKVMKKLAKFLAKIPCAKKIMSKYYYLAKKL